MRVTIPPGRFERPTTSPEVESRGEPTTGIEPVALRYECGALARRIGTVGDRRFPPPWRRARAPAVGAGIEPAEAPLTVAPVHQRTSPTMWRRLVAASAYRERPPRQRRRHVTSNCQRTRARARVVPAQGIEPRFSASETRVLAVGRDRNGFLLVRPEGIEPSTTD